MSSHTFRFALAAALAAVAAVSLPAGALATPPEPVAIELHGSLTGPASIAGTWVSTGAVSDAGTYVESFEIRGRTVHVTKTLTGSAGTIVIAAEAVVEFTSATTARFVAGHWRVVSGTGAYASLHGEGAPAAVSGYVDLAAGTIELLHEGVAHVDP